MSETSLVNYMISYAMAADKSVKIEDAVFETATNDPWSSGEAVVFMIQVQNHRSCCELRLLQAKELLQANA